MKRRGFSLLELVFVITLLGIISALTMESIHQYYDGIYRTAEHNRRIEEADRMLDQISKYLEYAVSSSIVNLDKDTATNTCTNDFTPDNSQYTLAFVAADADALVGEDTNFRPGWNEDVLVNATTLSALDASHVSADNIIQEAYRNESDVAQSNLLQSAIYNHDTTDQNACARFSWSELNNSAYHLINTFTDTTLSVTTTPRDGHEKFLISTGYAFRVANDGNFTMYTLFRPWQGERYTNAREQRLIGQKVAHFFAGYDMSSSMQQGVIGRGLVWRLKVCMMGLDENLNDTNDPSLTICRERRVRVRF